LASFLLCFVAGRGAGKGFYETSFGESTYIFRIFQLQGFNLGCSIAGEMNRIILILLIAASLKVSGQTVTNLRVVDGVIYKVIPPEHFIANGINYYTDKDPLWKTIDGNIVKVLTNEIIVEKFVTTPDGSLPTGVNIIIRNYPVKESPTVGKSIWFMAMQTGTSDYNGDRLELWDLGVPPTADDLRKLKADTEERQKAAQKELDDQRRVAAEKADAAKKASQAKVLKSNQDLADKGDAYGLLRMGERYRDGDGVEKDLAKAKVYLTKAAAAGSPTAADELSKLRGE
jgi:hypothetical protein